MLEDRRCDENPDAIAHCSLWPTGDTATDDPVQDPLTSETFDRNSKTLPVTKLAVNECHVGALQPGKKVNVRFTVEISHRENSGSVTAFVSDASETTIDQVSTRFLKVLG
jgi:hypothetical protein